MYSREYEGLELTFEASGGLVNSSLIMQDKETDTYWSIMKGSATAGELNGTQLVELPVSEKTAWKDWVARHPATRVLSVNGQEHAGDGYEAYWEAPDGYRGQQATDRRLETKTPIFAFERDGDRFAITHADIEGGRVVDLGEGALLFLHREPGSAMFRSTAAFVSRAGFVRDAAGWIELETGARFDPIEGAFENELDRLSGFDTFWYNWSLNNPGTKVIE